MVPGEDERRRQDAVGISIRGVIVSVTTKEGQRRANAVTAVIMQLPIVDPRFSRYRSILETYPNRQTAYIEAMKTA